MIFEIHDNLYAPEVPIFRHEHLEPVLQHLIQKLVMGTSLGSPRGYNIVSVGELNSQPNLSAPCLHHQYRIAVGVVLPFADIISSRCPFVGSYDVLYTAREERLGGGAGEAAWKLQLVSSQEKLSREQWNGAIQDLATPFLDDSRRGKGSKCKDIREECWEHKTSNSNEGSTGAIVLYQHEAELHSWLPLYLDKPHVREIYPRVPRILLIFGDFADPMLHKTLDREGIWNWRHSWAVAEHFEPGREISTAVPGLSGA
jgi:hypothetical protein